MAFIGLLIGAGGVMILAVIIISCCIGGKLRVPDGEGDYDYAHPQNPHVLADGQGPDHDEIFSESDTGFKKNVIPFRR